MHHYTHEELLPPDCGYLIGALFAGVGGLTRATEEVFNATPSWVADNDPAASRVLSHHYPDVLNLGDVTEVDWTQVPKVDILEGGTPCQDISHSGKKAGMTEGSRSNLWVAMREALDTLQPTYVVWENVHGAHSAKASSDLEYCKGCMGGNDSPPLRALGRVLGDLASLGFDAEWRSVRASDIGACHQRRRTFILAWHPERIRSCVTHPIPTPTGDPLTKLPTLPTPRTSDIYGTWNGRKSGGLDLRTTIFQLLEAEGPINWQKFTPAIERHAEVIGRPAPPPTTITPRGATRLSGRFCEWMMMWPDGYISDLIDSGVLTNSEAIRLSGNGVVTPQAVHALRDMISYIPYKEVV